MSDSYSPQYISIDPASGDTWVLHTSSVPEEPDCLVMQYSADGGELLATLKITCNADLTEYEYAPSGLVVDGARGRIYVSDDFVIYLYAIPEDPEPLHNPRIQVRGYGLLRVNGGYGWGWGGVAGCLACV